MSAEIVAVVLGLAIVAWFVPSSRLCLLSASAGAAITWFLTGRKSAATVEAKNDSTFVERLDRTSDELATEQREIDDAATSVSRNPSDNLPVSDDVRELRARLERRRRIQADSDADDL